MLPVNPWLDPEGEQAAIRSIVIDPIARIPILFISSLHI
jgi:hypothetical protein